MEKYRLMLFSLLIISLIVVVVYYAIKHAIKNDERDKVNNKRIILFNRRTREIKEVFNKEYIESKSWEVIAITPDSMIDSFIKYLKRGEFLDESSKYTGTASKGTTLLQWKFKRFIDEFSEI